MLHSSQRLQGFKKMAAAKRRFAATAASAIRPTLLSSKRDQNEIPCNIKSGSTFRSKWDPVLDRIWDQNFNQNEIPFWSKPDV